jgi:hypothetical protein
VTRLVQGARPLATHAIAARTSSNLLFGLFFSEGDSFSAGTTFPPAKVAAQMMKYPVDANEKK